MTADLLDEGAGGLDALDIAEQAEALGARLNTGSFFDGSFVSLNVLKNQLEPGLDLMSKVALEPGFPAAEFERIRQNYLGRQQQESRQQCCWSWSWGAAPGSATMTTSVPSGSRSQWVRSTSRIRRLSRLRAR